MQNNCRMIMSTYNSNHDQQSPVELEIIVMSAQGLKNTSFFGRRLRPFITLTGFPQNPAATNKVYKTKVDDEGDVNPTWGDTFRVSFESTFFYQSHSCIYIQLYTKHLMMGETQLGWCQIAPADIFDGLLPEGITRRLSYRLRSRDGSRGNGVINIAVKLLHLPQNHVASNMSTLAPATNLSSQAVIGVPVSMPPAALGGRRWDAFREGGAGSEW